MNKQRLKQINDIIVKISNIKDDIEDILNDEQDYFDNMPENLQGSERGQRSEDAIDYLEESLSSINDVIDDLNNVY